MRSIDAPMIAISRAAMSSMRSTAPASQVGFRIHPAAQAQQHGLGIKRKIGGVHGFS